jgi:hypothetical protein
VDEAMIEPLKPTAKLGSKYRDIITGFEGIAVAQTAWYNGCDRVSLQPPVDKDGKMQDAVGFDSTTLELVEDKPSLKRDNNGGPRNDPQRGM